MPFYVLVTGVIERKLSGSIYVGPFETEASANAYRENLKEPDFFTMVRTELEMATDIEENGPIKIEHPLLLAVRDLKPRFMAIFGPKNQ